MAAEAVSMPLDISATVDSVSERVADKGAARNPPGILDEARQASAALRQRDILHRIDTGFVYPSRRCVPTQADCGGAR